MSDQAHFEIEQDGPRFRWVFMLGDRRLIKAARWWNSEQEAEADVEYVRGLIGDARKTGPDQP